jgi:hypothetical protein
MAQFELEKLLLPIRFLQSIWEQTANYYSYRHRHERLNSLAPASTHFPYDTKLGLDDTQYKKQCSLA